MQGLFSFLFFVTNYFFYSFTDDSDWNNENLKLGLIEGQSYLNLNLDINQYLQIDNLNASTMTNDLMNASLKNENNKTLKQNADILNKENIDFYKKSLIVNYWEFSS